LTIFSLTQIVRVQARDSAILFYSNHIKINK